MITNRCALGNQHVDSFLRLIPEFCSNYNFFQTSVIQSSMYHEIPAQVKHIQLLHRVPAIPDHAGQWICTFYDSKDLIIFDSSNSKELHSDHERVLRVLHPYIFTNRGSCIQFPKVQGQSNATDSGVFAIAFATTILHGLKPNFLDYNEDYMRLHLHKMLINNQIHQFPCVSKKIPQYLISGCVIKYNESNRKKIVDDERLNDDHILHFNHIVKYCSYYKPQDTVLLDVLNRIEEIPRNQKHIQILFQTPPPEINSGH